MNVVDEREGITRTQLAREARSSAKKDDKQLIYVYLLGERRQTSREYKILNIQDKIYTTP